jgi:hypothetical protein
LLNRYNHLDPTINKGEWNEEEDEQLRQAVVAVGECRSQSTP